MIKTRICALMCCLKKIFFRTLHRTIEHRELWRKVNGTSKKLGSREGDSHDWMTLCRYIKGCMMHSCVNMKTLKEQERKYGNNLYLLQNIANSMTLSYKHKMLEYISYKKWCMCIYYISSSPFEWKWNSGKRKVRSVKEYTFLL